MTNPGKTKRQSAQEPESLCKKRATIRRIAEKQGSVEKTLRESEEKYQSIFNNAQVGIFRSRISDGGILESNLCLAKMYGYNSRAEFSGKFFTSEHYVDPGTRKRMLASFRHGRLENFDARLTRKNGSIIWVLFSARIFPKNGYLEGVVVDITERKQASQQLESNYALLTALINSPRDIIIFSLDKDYRYTAFNRKHCEEMKKVWAADINIGDNMLDFIRIPELRAKAKASMDRALSGEIITEIQHQFNLDIYYEFNWNPVYFNKEVVGVTSFIRDITERKQAEEEIRTLSLTDDLTGLYNRRAFFVLAKQQLRIAKRTKREMFLFYADIDGLKHINDMFGHQVGDTALIDAAVVLKKTFRESDIIARIGGDEFVVLTIETTIESKEVLVKRLQENLEVHNLQENRKYRLDVSIGGAFCDSQHPCSLDDLIAQADKLMYDQKGEKKKKWSPETHLPNGRDR